MTEDSSCSRSDGYVLPINGLAGNDTIHQIADGVYRRVAHAHLSPSLWQDREEPAFELKFQLDPKMACQVAEWARKYLTLDPHADPEQGSTYSVHGLYFDTPGLDVFHRSPGYKRKKYRLRRYGSGSAVFLEQKRKSSGKVAKRRTQIDASELARLLAESADPAWLGSWFHQRLRLRRLQPSCCISYQRQAYFGHNGDGPLRLTLDSNVRAQAASHWHVEEIAQGPTLTDQVLLELKFRRHLPGLFRVMMQDFGLEPGPLSKYRIAIHALGKTAAGGTANA